MNQTAPLSRVNAVAYVVIVLSVVFITYQIIGGMFSYFMIGTENFADAKSLNLTRTAVSAGQFLLILVPVIVLNMLRGDTITNGFNLYKPDWKITLLAVIGIIAVQPFLQYFVVIQNKILFSIPFAQGAAEEMKKLYDLLESTTLKLVMSYSIPEFIVVVFVIAVTPAICEEILFRGVILGSVEMNVTKRRAAIITGLIFAGYHFHPFNFIPLLLLGIYLSLIAQWGGSVVPAVVAHFLNNFISAYAVYIMGEDFVNDQELTGGDLLNYGMLSAGSLIVFIAILMIMNRYHKKKTEAAANG